MNKFSDVSTYYLVLEYLDGGHVGVLPEIEPISSDELLSALKDRTGRNLGDDPKAWASWFIGNSEYGTELERANLWMFMQSQASLRKIWSKFDDS